MGRQTEVYRQMHPEQFSDSKVEKKGKLDRDLLDFYLSTLTSKGLEKKFEECCRHIAEVEICPNLLPQTGPTGGGDSKVDSETYPVANSISALWYHSDSDKAASERWAFAISAKKDWKPKVNADVEKIVNANSFENRGYSRIFFMTNQYISDKKRAETECVFRERYQIDVRILDRTWLLDKIMGNPRNVDIVIKSFGLSDCFSDEIHLGDKDYKRKLEFDQNEARLTSLGIKTSEKIALAQRTVILGRELELPKDQMMGYINRSIMLSKEFGTRIDLANAYYEAAWTVYWWYTDTDIYYIYYKNYQDIALLDGNVNLFNHLVTLWINLYTMSKEGSVLPIDEHTTILQNMFEKFQNDRSKPNSAIEARAAFLPMRILLQEEIDGIIDEMIDVLDDSIGHLDLDLYPIERIIQELPIFEDAKRYNELFERMISIMSKQEQQTEAARMLARRGHHLKADKPYEALAYFSRSIMAFFNANSKELLVTALMEMGEIFERVGLLWAARNFYYFSFCLCLNQYMKFGEASSWFFISAHLMKYLEVRLGHIIYAVEFDFLERIAMACYPDKTEESDEQADNFDYILATQIQQTQHDTLKELGCLPAYLKSRGLLYSSAAINYELGYYDSDILKSLDGNEAAFDDLMMKWKSQPTFEQSNHLPWYGLEPSCKMQTKILGCAIEAIIVHGYEHGELEIAASILATIESFFGTGVKNDLFSLSNKIYIEIIYITNCDKFIKADIQTDKSNSIRVSFTEYDDHNIVDAQKEFSDFVAVLMARIISIMFPFKTEFEKVKKMAEDDAAFSRAYTFTNSVFFGMETLGKDAFSFSSVLQDYESLPMKRTVPNNCNEFVKSCNEDIQTGPNFVCTDMMPDDLDFNLISNEDITTTSIINISLWNSSQWKGVMYIVPSLSYSMMPLLSLIFEKESGTSIFEEWIREFGTVDDENKMCIRIIKEIDIRHPYWYRVIIGSSGCDERSTRKPQMIMHLSRVHTMTPDNDCNLSRFEKALKLSVGYSICPSILSCQEQLPNVIHAMTIRKKPDSLVIYNACDVVESDVLAYAGILPTDIPIIPTGKEDAPILKIIAKKKMIADSKHGYTYDQKI